MNLNYREREILRLADMYREAFEPPSAPIEDQRAELEARRRVDHVRSALHDACVGERSRSSGRFFLKQPYVPFVEVTGKFQIWFGIHKHDGPPALFAKHPGDEYLVDEEPIFLGSMEARLNALSIAYEILRESTGPHEYAMAWATRKWRYKTILAMKDYGL